MAAQAPPEKIKASQPTIVKSPRETMGHVSALGVLAELETIEPALRKHQQEAAQKLTQTLTEKVKTVLPTLTRTRFDDATLTKIASEVAQESAPEILENVSKIQNFAQAPQVVADSLTQSIVAHPQLDGQLKTGEEKIFEKLTKQAQDVTTTHQQDLSKAAVLGAIVNITKLEKPNEQIQTLAKDTVDQVVESQYPLAPPEVNQTLYGNTAGFLQTYVDNFKKQVTPQLAGGNIPNFAAFQQVKSTAFEKSTTEFAGNVTRYADRIKPTDLTARLGCILGLDPGLSILGQPQAPTKSLDAWAFRLALASNRGQEDFYNSAASHDKEWLEKAFRQASGQVEKFKSQRTLSYKDRIVYNLALKNFGSLQKTIAYSTQNQKRAKNWMALVQALPPSAGAAGQNVSLTYQSAILTQQAAFGQIPGVFVPRSLAGNQLFLARNTLSLLSPKFGLGDLFGSLKAAWVAPTKGGMGMALGKAALPLSVVNTTGSLLKRITKAAAALWGGMLLWMLGLGKAALTGFLIGSAIGVGVGGGVGLAIAFSAGPFWPIVALVTVPGGAAVGGLIFGVAGGLIALGVASGSATLISMGAGASIGAVIGGYAGFVIGSAIASTLVTLAAAACAATGLGCILVPIATVASPVIIATSTAIGAAIGALTGGAIGYVFGKYVLTPITNIFIGIKDFFTGAAGVGAGAATGVAGFITGLASTVWGGITGAAGGAFGLLSGAANFIVGGLSSISIPASMAAIPVAGGIGAVVIGGTIVGIVTATSFFNPEGEILSLPGENQYAKVEKKVTATQLNRGPSTFISFENSDLDEPLKFDVAVTAKTDLTNITCSDEATRTNQGSSRTELSVPPPSCPSTIAANEPFNLTPFVIEATHPDFDDSLVVNIFTFRANNPDGTPIVLSISASVAIGDAPMSCPGDWPTRFGHISQGPQGPYDHNTMRLNRGEEAIDIGDGPGGESINGVDALATFEGDVIYVENSDPGPGTFGAQIQVQGTCGSVTFTARWAHLKINSIPFDLTDPTANRHVTPGMVLGKIDDTGESTGPHLHYSFLGGLTMQPPNIPDTIPDPTCEDGPNRCPISWSL